MMLKINKSRKGFTLVEIMIVVAIIALLAAIAVPNFLRARQRSQATRVLDELRLIDAAIDQYAIENNKKQTDTVDWLDVKKYIKEGTPLYNSIENGTAAKDAIGSDYDALTTVADGVKIAPDTVTEFEELIEDKGAFWGQFDPTAGGGGGGSGS